MFLVDSTILRLIGLAATMCLTACSATQSLAEQPPAEQSPAGQFKEFSPLNTTGTTGTTPAPSVTMTPHSLATQAPSTQPTSASPSPLTTSRPASEFTAPPTPAATLPPAPPPASTPGLATIAPITLTQWIPPDVVLSGIAISVSGTRYEPGQRVAVSAQAPIELTGFTCYVLYRTTTGRIADLTRGTVGPGGRFTLMFTPTGPVQFLVGISQAGIDPAEPYTLDDIVSRSDVVTVTPLTT